MHLVGDARGLQRSGDGIAQIPLTTWVAVTLHVRQQGSDLNERPSRRSGRR
jgi:hypothetical protein